MVRIGIKKAKRFTVSTRLIAGSKGRSIRTITPGLRRIKIKRSKPILPEKDLVGDNGA